jgi:hypothetical protein
MLPSGGWGGVGSGFGTVLRGSADTWTEVYPPSLHHCLEDLPIQRTRPRTFIQSMVEGICRHTLLLQF